MANILILDDQKEILLTFSRILLKDGHSVFTAINMDEALSVLQSKEIDVIISDIYMPEQTGFDFLKEIRTNHPKLEKVPVILSSNSNDDADLEKAAKLGCVEYLIKPVSVAKLRAAITRLVWRMQNESSENKNLVQESKVSAEVKQLIQFSQASASRGESIHMGVLMVKSPVRVLEISQGSIDFESVSSFSENQIVEIHLPTLRREGFENIEFKVLSCQARPNNYYHLILAPVDFKKYSAFYFEYKKSHSSAV